VIVNRALPPQLGVELATLDERSLDAEAVCVTRYALGHIEMQARVLAGAGSLAPRVVVLRSVSGLDGEGRLERLAELGRELRDALGAATGRP
jgi:hypothetical protein